MSDWVLVLRFEINDDDLAALRTDLQHRIGVTLRTTSVRGWLWDDTHRPPQPVPPPAPPSFYGTRAHSRTRPTRNPA